MECPFKKCKKLGKKCSGIIEERGDCLGLFYFSKLRMIRNE